VSPEALEESIGGRGFRQQSAYAQTSLSYGVTLEILKIQAKLEFKNFGGAEIGSTCVVKVWFFVRDDSAAVIYHMIDHGPGRKQ